MKVDSWWPHEKGDARKLFGKKEVAAKRRPSSPLKLRKQNPAKSPRPKVRHQGGSDRGRS